MITVLYEDQRGPRNGFGLHRFVCQLVVDRAALPLSVYEVEDRLIQGIPLKGNGNVRKRCRKDLPKLAKQCRRVFAVYDEDRVPELVGLNRTDCRPLLCGKLIENCQPIDALEVVLLRRNQESLIETIKSSGLVGLIHDSVYDRALAKDLMARDSVFIQCATSTTLEIRQKLLPTLPDLDRLVAKICAAISTIS